MAKDISHNPWKFDTAAEGEGFGPNQDSVSVNFEHKPYVSRFRVYGGNGGAVLVSSRQNASVGNNDKHDVLNVPAMPAGETLDFPIGTNVDGIYIDTLPLNALVYVYLNEGE